MIQFEHVSYAYGDHSNTIEDISFVLKKNTFLSIIAPSGAGKSTILRLSSGVLIPTKGKIISSGRTRFVFQDPRLIRWRTVWENIAFPLEIEGNIQHERVQDEIDRVGLSGFENHLPDELSMGMQSRVSLARALVSKPEVLLMDEPFAALDEILRTRMQQMIQKRIKGSTSVIFVTHSIKEAILLGDSVMVLSTSPAHIQGIYDVSKIDDSLSSEALEIQKTLRKDLKKSNSIYRAQVVHGESRGRTLGFPTLNLDLTNLPFDHGVYASKVTIDGRVYKALLHYGPKSTFNGKDELVEVHVLEYSETRKPDWVTIEFFQFIRPTKRFGSPVELVDAMENDRRAILSYFEQGAQ